MKKVAIICQPFDIGGAQIMVKNLVKNLVAVDVAIFAMGKRVDNDLTKEVEAACSVEYCDGSGFFDRYRKLKKALKKYKPDVLHSHLSGNRYAAVYTIFHRVRMVSTMHTVPNKAYRPKVEKLIRFVQHISKLITLFLQSLGESNPCWWNENPLS